MKPLPTGTLFYGVRQRIKPSQLYLTGAKQNIKWREFHCPSEEFLAVFPEANLRYYKLYYLRNGLARSPLKIMNGLGNGNNIYLAPRNKRTSISTSQQKINEYWDWCLESAAWDRKFLKSQPQDKNFFKEAFQELKYQLKKAAP